MGWDVTGTVEGIGKDVTQFEEGDFVMGLINMPGFGETYAEYVVAKTAHLAIKPPNIKSQEAAAIPMAALTAWQAVVTLEKTENND